MRYIVTVEEILESEVIVEADSVEEAVKRATLAVWNMQKGGGVTLHHNSNTNTECLLLPLENQKGGAYYDEEVVE